MVSSASCIERVTDPDHMVRLTAMLDRPREVTSGPRKSRTLVRCVERYG
jgi:hypothetical protein